MSRRHVYVKSQTGCFVIDQKVLGFIAHPNSVNAHPPPHTPRLKFVELTLERVSTDNELNAQFYTGMDSGSFPNHVRKLLNDTGEDLFVWRHT